MAKKRKRLPAGLKRDLLIEAGYHCGNPRCHTILAVHILEDHHIVYVSQGGRDEAANLLALCPNCHALHHAGDIANEAIRHWKGMLLTLNGAFDRATIDLLRLLYQSKSRPDQLWFSADSVLRFAAPIADGLVSYSSVSATPHQIPESSHRIQLTDRGLLFMEAWLADNGSRYAAYLQKAAAGL